MAKEGDSGKVFMAVSRNDGVSFERDCEILPADVCPCCQLTAFIDDKDLLYVSSRQVEGKFRDSVVMVSSDCGRSFSPRQRVVGSRWEIEGCPLKATSVAAAGGVIRAAYFTAGEQSRPAPYVVRSTDGGRSWSEPILALEGAVTSDAPVLRLAGKTLHLFWHAKMTDGRPRGLHPRLDRHGREFRSDQRAADATGSASPTAGDRRTAACKSSGNKARKCAPHGGSARRNLR